MDPRIREHARTIVDHPTSAEAGDNVIVSASSVAEDLATVIHKPSDSRGADVVAVDANLWFTCAFLRVGDDDYEIPEHVLVFYEETDVIIRACDEANATE